MSPFQIWTNFIILLAILGIVLLVVRRLPDAVESSKVSGNLKDEFTLWVITKRTFASLFRGLAKFLSKFFVNLKELLGFVRKVKGISTSRSMGANVNISRSSQVMVGSREDAPLVMDEGYFLDLIRSNPKEKMNYDSLGKYYLNNSQFLEASELYEYLTRAHPEEASFWARLAFSLSNISKFEDAVVAYEKCLYLEEPTSTRFYNLALCLKQTGRTSDAFATAKKAWEMSREEDVRLLLEELSLELNSAKTTTPEVKQRMVVNRVVKAANLEKPVEEETVVSKKTLKPRIKQVTNPSEPVVVPRTRVPAEKAYYKGKKSYFELESSSVKPTMKSRISGKEPAGNDAPETVTTKASKKKVLAPTEN